MRSVRRLFPLILPALLLALAFAPTAQAEVTNGSLEDNANGWQRASFRHASPICTLAGCGGDAEIVGPLSGTHFAWFGRTAQDEVANIWQNVTLEAGKTHEVTFHMWVGDNSSPTSRLELFWGGTQLADLRTADLAAYTSGYGAVTTRIRGFADGTPRELMLFFSKSEDSIANISVDDISITERPPVITDYTCVVPKLKKGMKAAKVKKKLKKAKCGVKIQKKRSGKVKKGRLIKLAKKKGTQLTGGTKVKAVISKGK